MCIRDRLSLVLGETNYGIRQHLLLIPLLLWVAFSYFQTTALDPGTVQSLSPASYEAYTTWLAPVLDSKGPSEFPISIAVHDSRHACAFKALMAGLLFAVASVFHARGRIALLMNAIAIAAAIQACFGLLRLVAPRVDLFDAALDAYANSFGSFVNRNNASLFLNYGVGACLGLLSWRLMAMTGQELDDDQFEFNDLASLTSDRDSIVGVVCMVFCIGGLLLCGSRGGLASALCGALFAFGWVRQRRGLMTLPIVGAAAAVAAAILIIPFQLDLASISRFEFLDPEASSLLADGRMNHWPEGFAAAKAHFPLGSGLSTYAYAYLPHQSSGMPGWAHHADNLWLELLVEQGYIGIIFVLVLLVICIRSLVRIRHSPDPIDHGLRTTGWYFVGVVLLSQLFDFGLIVPANLVLLVVFMGALVARDAAMHKAMNAERLDEYPSESEDGDDESEKPSISKGRALFHRFRGRLAVAILGVIAVAVSWQAMPQLRRDAVVELLARSVDHEVESIATDSQALKDWSQELNKNLGDDPEPALLDTLADVEYRRARLFEVIQSNPSSVEESSRIYQMTNAVNRRTKPTDESRANQAEVVEAYRVSKKLYERSLRQLPLGIVNRSGQLYLDFVDPNPDQTQQVMQQLQSLYHKKPKTLILLGEFAANSKYETYAAQMWRDAVRLNPAYTEKVIKLSNAYPDISIKDVIPEDAASTRKATSYVLRTNEPGAEEYLAEAVERLDCSACESLEEKADCYSLSGDVAYRLGQYDSAFGKYHEAIKHAPANGNIALKLVKRLRTQGRNPESLMEARKARARVPNDQRFDEVIKQMAADDLRIVEQEREKRQEFREELKLP